MSLALSGDTIAYLMGLGLDAEQMKGLVDRLQRDALAVTPPTAINGVNEERERLRNLTTYAERKRAKDRERQRVLREQERQSRDVAGGSRDNRAMSTATEGDAPHPPEPKVPPAPPSKAQTPEPPKTPQEGVKKVPKLRRAFRRCPASWTPTEATLRVLGDEGFDPGALERALTRMRDHEFRTGRSDWDATFRNWVRGDRDRQKPAHERPHTDPKFEARQANLARALAGADSAARRDWKP